MTEPHKIPLYGSGMHDHVLVAAELGERVALAQDSEDCGWSALNQLSYEQWVERDKVAS